MGHISVRGVSVPTIGGDTVLSHRVQQLRDLLLDDRIGWSVGGPRALGLLSWLCSHSLLSLLCDDGLLLLLLCLCLGDGSLLLMHTGPEAADVSRLCRGSLLCCRQIIASSDGTRVHKLGCLLRIEESRLVARGVEVHVDVRWVEGSLSGCGAEVDKVIVRAQACEVTIGEAVLIHALVDSQGVGDGSWRDARCLSVELIVMARAGKSWLG